MMYSKTITIFDIYCNYRLVACCDVTALLRWFPKGLFDATFGFSVVPWDGKPKFPSECKPAGWYAVRRFVTI